MASQTPQSEAVRSAISSISTCSPATVVAAKELLLSSESGQTGGGAKANSRAATGPRSTQSKTNGGPRATAAKSRTGTAGKEALSDKEKAGLATHIINAALKSLGDASKPQPPAPARQQDAPEDLVRTATRNLRRSNSAPMSPMQVRSLNRTLTSPTSTTKQTRVPSFPSNTSSYLPTVECARVAFSALRSLQDAGKVALPELQLDAGMSSFVGKLIGLGLLDQAAKELRILRRRLGRPSESGSKKQARPAGNENSSAGSLSELLDFGETDLSGQALGLVIASQLQVLRILTALKKPSQIEPAIPFIKSSCSSSPLNLILRLAKGGTSDQAKAARHMEALSQLLLALSPSVANKDDAIALESRLSVAPAAALSLQEIALEARIHWWSLADHEGDVDRDVLVPVSRCISAFARRRASEPSSRYRTVHGIFKRIYDHINIRKLHPTLATKSPLATIYQTLGTLSREAGQLKEATAWAEELRALLNRTEDSAAKYCSVLAQLLSLHLKDPGTYLQSNELLSEVLDGIQGPLRGDTVELEELLANVRLVRKSAMNILAGQIIKDGPDHQQISPSAKQMLESFILQCPRFCIRWLGKPPASKSSTKDFVRYEQRRQLLTKSAHQILDSTLMVAKMLVDEKRTAWDQIDSVLKDLLTLLEFLGELPLPDASASYYVKISHFYYMNYNALRQQPGDSRDVEVLRALRHSIDCVKHRSTPEKEKAQLIPKLERMADICRASGQVGEALGALQSIRTSLVDDGALDAVAKALSSGPAFLAWTSNEKANILSRTLVAIFKLEQVPIDWTTDLPEPECAAVLEHRLHFIPAGGNQNQPNMTLAHPCVDSLLRTYYPTRFPVRRLRTLLRLLSVSIDSPDAIADVIPQIDAVLGLADNNDLGEDSALAGYLPHYRSLYKSLAGLSQAFPDPGELNACLSSWSSIVRPLSTNEDLEGAIDNPAELLAHLESVADFCRTMGHDTLLMMTLELSSAISKLSSGPALDEQLKYDSPLALHYVKIGACAKAQRILELSKGRVQEVACLSADGVIRFHLSFAEYFISVGSFSKAGHHLEQAQAADRDSPSKAKQARPGRRSLIALASFLQSLVALGKGESHHSLIHARNSVRILFQDWMKLEKDTTSVAAQQNQEDAIKAPLDGEQSMSMSLRAPETDGAHTAASPEFWKLFNPLFQSTSSLSSVYAHLGMFQETVYYAEQAQKIASSTNAVIYLAQSESWLATIWLKACKPERAIDLMAAARSKIQDNSQTCLSATLACKLGDLYHDTKDDEGEQAMIGRAEAIIRSITGRGTDEGDGASDQGVTKLEAKMSKLNINDKAQTSGRRPKATRGAKAPAKATAAAKKNAAPEPEPSSSTDDAVISTIRATVTVQKALSLLAKKDWQAAIAILREVQRLSNLPAAYLPERVAVAACLLGQSTEQMAGDAVFSVIQDSTLSFPSVCSSGSDSADRSPTMRSSALAGGRHASQSRGRDSSKERWAQGFLENLREAQECLVEAHSAAALTGDASLLHRISGMLQSVVILHSAASSTKPGLMGHPGYAILSVEMARNLTWRRERRALLLEKTATKTDGLDWPVSITDSDARRSSLGSFVDMGRFQRDYMDIIPKEWSVVSIALSDNKNDLCITKLQAGHSPFVIRLPLDRASSRDADNEAFDFQQGRSELLEIIRLTNDSCHDSRDMSVKGARSEWWAEREALDDRLGELLENVEHVWLGGFKGIFSQHPHRADLLARFQKSFQNILDRHLPSRRQVRGRKSKASASSPKITLDPRVLELFIGLGDATVPDCDFDDVLLDLLYFVVDILQFHGERNAYDEIDFDKMVVETLDALHSYHAAVKNSTEISEGVHTVLVLDKALHVFPWESLPCMRGLAVSRVPSLACLRRLIVEQRPAGGDGLDEAAPPRNSPSGHVVSPRSGAYMLNPGSDLKTTQATFGKPLSSLGSSWTRIVSRPPTEAEFEAALAESDVVLYFGHGSGAQYIRGRTIRRLDKCRAAALLMGCSSASLGYNGEFEVNGPVWNYLLAGCPAVVGTLWDVTDRDIDRFAGRVFEEWGLLARGTFADGDDGKARTGKGRAKAERVTTGGGGSSSTRGKRTRAGEESMSGSSSSSSSSDDDEGDGRGRGRASLVEAVARAREVPRFRHLTAAAVCVYGIPVYMARED